MDGRPAGPERVGLPEAVQLGLERGDEGFALAGQEVGAVQLDERLPQAVQRVADGAAFGLGGVGGEDELDRKAVQQRLGLLGGEALRGEVEERGPG